MINYFDKLKNVFIFMPRLSISLLIIFLLMSVNKCHGDYYDDYPYPDDYYDDNDYNDNNYYDNFNETLKNYLVENGYFDSDRLIEPYEMKKILYEVISEGDPDKNSENVKKIFSQLAERFTEVYYNDRKQIRGKDIYGLINIDDIWARFDDYLDYNLSSKYDDFFDDDENDDLDDNSSIFDEDL